MLFLAKWCVFILFSLGAFSSDAAPVKVSDYFGRKITVPEKVERIVALGPGCLRLVVYLQAFDTVIAKEALELKMDPARRPYAAAMRDRIKKLPTVSQGGPAVFPDAERLIALNPQVIFITTLDKKSVQLLQKQTQLPVIALSYGQLGALGKGFYRSLEIISTVLHRSARYKELLLKIKQLKADLKRRVAKIPLRPTVYVGGIGYKGSHGIKSTETKYPPFEWVNAKNVAQPMGRFRNIMIDKEQLLVWNPDFLFLDASGLKHIARDMRQSPAYYLALKAVRKGRVYLLQPYNYYNTNVELALANAYAIGKWLYPQRFADVDVAKKTAEIVTFFNRAGSPAGKSAISAARRLGLGYRKVSLENGRFKVQ